MMNKNDSHSFSEKFCAEVKMLALKAKESLMDLSSVKSTWYPLSRATKEWNEDVLDLRVPSSSTYFSVLRVGGITLSIYSILSFSSSLVEFEGFDEYQNCSSPI